MKKQSLILATAVAATLASSMTMAVELEANMGIVSTYVYRGLVQAGTAAQGGVDADFGNGFSAGIWGSDVGGQGNLSAAQGIEYDLYGGYNGEMDDFSYSVGATVYLYTGDFDTPYTELNLGAGYGPVAVDLAIGTHEQKGASDNSYTFLAVSGDVGPISATYGVFSDDYTGSYIELSTSTDIGGADAGISLINSNASFGARNFVTDGTTLVFSLSKAFEL